MKKNIILLNVLLVSIFTIAQPRESLTDRVRQAFNLVGRWEILKMEVDRSETVNNPNTVPEASLAQANVTVKSELGSYGHFTVAPGGTINGEGIVVYNYRVGAGSNAFAMGPVPLAIGAVAMMHGDDGVRKFVFDGSADLSNRTISLNVFQPQGGDLKMIIRPGGKTFTSVLWPPMTRVGPTKVIVAGSSLFLRATAVIQGIKVTFEAVKHVDLAGLFGDLDTYIEKKVTTIINNNGGNTTNTSTGGTTNPTTNTTTNTTNNEEGSTSVNAVLAGSVNVPIGGSASVVFSTPRANTNYAISFGPMSTGTNQPIVSFTNKSGTGFKVHVKGTGEGNVRIDWMVAGYND